MEPIKEYSKTELTLENLVIPEERLLNTPSAKDGMPRDVEVSLRITGCEYIQSAGLLLRLPQSAMATAQILFHRFYYAKSFVKFNCYYASMACLFLAGKIEECCRRLRDVLNVFHHLRQRRKGSKTVPMEYVSEEYYRMRNNIIKYERYILKELGFCVHVQHPHKLIITCLQILTLEKNQTLVQKAWNLMNDGLRTNIFVRYRVETIACACIFLAARLVKIPLPELPPWWLLLDVSLRDMKAISLELLALYQRPQTTLEELEKEVDILKENLMSQKKVDIKEINVKKTTTPADTPPTVKVDSPDSSSDVPTSSAVNNKLSPSPKVSPLVVNNYRKEEKTRNYRERSPVNGHKRKLSSDSPPLLEKRSKILDTRRRHSYSPEPTHNSHSKRHHSPSPADYHRRSPSPAEYRRRRPSPVEHHRHRSPMLDVPRRYQYSISPQDIKERRRKRSHTPDDYYDSRKRRRSSSPTYHSDNKRSRYSLTPEHNSDSNFQPIVGPIKISSNSDSDVEDAKLNGIPAQYREEHRHKRHRHKHRSEKHRHKHRERSRSHERSHNRSHDRSRDRHKHSRHEEQEYKREVTLHHSNSIGRSRDRHKLNKSDSYSYR